MLLRALALTCVLPFNAAAGDFGFRFHEVQVQPPLAPEHIRGRFDGRCPMCVRRGLRSRVVEIDPWYSNPAKYTPEWDEDGALVDMPYLAHFHCTRGHDWRQLRSLP